MPDSRKFIISVAALGLAAGCLNGDTRANPDAGTVTTPDGSTNLPPDPDALPPPGEFEGLALALVPQTPRPNFEFTLSIRAVDEDGRLFRDYNGVIQIEDSEGAVQGLTEDIQVTGGTIFVPLLFEGEFEDVTLTVTDQDDSDISAEIGPFNVTFEGDRAELRDVVINEINWYGPLAQFLGPEDVWIELRNVSDETLNLSQWSIEGAGVEGETIAIFSGTELEPDGYLLLANFRNPEGSALPTSLTGVPNVQIHSGEVPLELPDEGTKLVLRDVDDTLIDETPDATDGWAAGDGASFLSMERVEDDGYGDGSLASQWVTFNPSAASTTHPGSIDDGTPGADSSDQTLTASMPFITSFNASQPKFEMVSSNPENALRSSPPPGTVALTPPNVLSTNVMRTGFDSAPMRTIECVALGEFGENSELSLSIFAMQSTENDHSEGGSISVRHAVEWFSDSRCQDRIGAIDNGDGINLQDAVGEYTEVTANIPVPAGVTHAKFRIETRLSASGVDDAWAADDFTATLEEASGSPD
jgi:hypothetical protein